MDKEELINQWYAERDYIAKQISQVSEDRYKAQEDLKLKVLELKAEFYDCTRSLILGRR